ncbi:MAG: hypothetical protein KBG15_19810 [Kofleriaceae bacterium]|nr:hypothetical protein [Kofleriaceae bacterium]
MQLQRFGSCVLAALFCSTTAPTLVHAQPGQPTRVDAGLLLHRIPEQLATEGTLLSRLGLTLQVEAIGDKFLLSLLDTSTGQIVAYSKAEHLPADAEAAIATVTHVVADMVARVRPQATPTVTVTPNVATPQAAADPDLDRRIREFREKKIDSGRTMLITASRYGASMSTSWTPVRGPLHTELSADEFFRVVGRPDFADRYNSRVSTGNTLFYGGIALGLAAIAYGGYTIFRDEPSRDYLDPAQQDQFPEYLVWSGIGAGITLTGTLLGRYYLSTAGQSAETNIALAEAYNRKLRADLRIPDSVSQRQRTRPTYSHRLALTPTAGTFGGGLSLAGSF